MTTFLDAARIPLNPKLRPEFDRTPHQQRSKEELDEWWNRPYAVRLENGVYEVRCLYGDASDRASYLGEAQTYEEACVLAKRVLQHRVAVLS